VKTRPTLLKRLRALRAERGLSQMALAERAGIARTYLARLELGQQDPTLATLEKLARALRVRIGELLERQGPTADQVEKWALLALRATPGEWYCPPCWEGAAGLSPDYLPALGMLARSVIRNSNEFERISIDDTTARCSRAGAPGCDFGRDGAKRRGWNTWGWMVRAKARDSVMPMTSRKRRRACPRGRTRGD